MYTTSKLQRSFKVTILCSEYKRSKRDKDYEAGEQQKQIKVLQNGKLTIDKKTYNAKSIIGQF